MFFNDKMMMVSYDESNNNNNNNNSSSIHSPSGKSDIIILDIKEESMDASIENGGNNDDDRNCTSMESADYIGLLDTSDDNGKRYYCQRCLNHGLEFQRKGHKPSCKYATCKCELCMMVEQRRQINYQLSIRKGDDEMGDSIINGRKIRRPKCARCSAHGQKQALRGHKKATCPYNSCECDMCALVENRRVLMARQIRVRRTQQRERLKQSSDSTPEPMERNSVLKRLLKPQPQIISSPTNNNNNNTVNLISKLSIQSLSKADSPTKSNILGHTKKSAFHPTTVSVQTVPLRKSTGTEISITNGRRTEVTEEEVTDPQIPPVPPGLFTPEQMEFIMKLFAQASSQQQQQQRSHLPSTVPINPFIYNHHHHHHNHQQQQQQSAAIAAMMQQFTNSSSSQYFSHRLFTGFPTSTNTTPPSNSSTIIPRTVMPSMVNPFLFSCFQQPTTTNNFSSAPQFLFPPFLATQRRPS